MEDKKIFEYKNSNYFYKKFSYSNDISYAMKFFNDYNEDNYIITYINSKNLEFKFDEDLYNSYHKEYYEYYFKNPLIKILIYTEGKKDILFCNFFLKFINRLIYYRSSISDTDFILNDFKNYY